MQRNKSCNKRKHDYLVYFFCCSR